MLSPKININNETQQKLAWLSHTFWLEKSFPKINRGASKAIFVSSTSLFLKYFMSSTNRS